MTKEELETLWRDKSNWRGGIIYYCKKDPRLVVPKRVKWLGWTMNCVHPRAIGIIVFIFVTVLLPFIVESKLNIATPLVVNVTLAVVVVLVIALCAYLPSRTE